MRTSIAGAVVLLAGAGASTAAALTSGSNLALSGSDTLYEVTQLVLTSCGGVFTGGTGFASKGMSYLGGGSGVGAVQMQTAAQEIAPMSRALKNTEYCSNTPDNAADLMVGLDGVAVVMAKTSSCSTSTVNNVGNPSFSILAGGTGSSTGTYTLDGSAGGLGQSIDALRLLFMGIDNSGSAANANFGCGTDVRKTLIKNWNNLFSTPCAGGATHCPSGVTHVWRRPDVSGTTDAFQGVLLAQKGSGRGLGTMDFVPSGATQKQNPFCNTFDAVDPAHPSSYLNQTATLTDQVTTTPLSNGRINDQQDLDPVRTPCDANDMVCGIDGKLGVVLPIFIPDVNYPTGEIYPATDCSGSCVLTPIITGGALPIGFKCPNGTNPIAGRCFLPYIEPTAKDPRCRVTDPTTRCFGTPSGVDGRVWNQPVIVLSTEVPAGLRFSGATYQYGVDRNNRLLTGSFFRQHMLAASSYNTRAPDANYTGTCTERDDTGQIGCLADADDCSVGYAAREAAKTFPGNVADQNKALKVNTIAPFPDSNITDLLTTTGTIYPIARRLYLATGPGGAGFQTLPGQGNGLPGQAGAPTSGEAMLAKCYSKDSIVGPALTANGFIPIPSGSGGIQCIDYPQTASTTTPPVNAPGPGNVALGGCGAGANVDACAGVAPGVNGWLFGQ
jgi:ABC-type phosphate transport system substrate-binding protein